MAGVIDLTALAHNSTYRISVPGFDGMGREKSEGMPSMS